MILLPGFVCAQPPATGASTVGDMALPGGIKAAVAATNDPLPADRGQFFVDLIRRTYSTPLVTHMDPRDIAIRALVAHLERARLTAGAADTVPLPLPSNVWTDVVFAGRVPADGLAAAILDSRTASLFYYGALALDGPTREWLASQRALIPELAGRLAPAFAVAAPGFRVADGRVRLPGPPRAERAWENLLGRSAADPGEFLRALLGTNEGRTGYLLASMSELTPEQIGFALGGDQSDAVAGLRRLVGVLDRVAPGWKVAERTLWRPRRDPALLLSDLAVDEQGRPVLPGSRPFWSAVFANESPAAARRRDADLAGDAPEFAWLCEQVFAGTPVEQRRRYDSLLFASRVLTQGSASTALDAVEAARGALLYPALTATLERARVEDVAVYAAASRRAARLSAISQDERRVRALSQFQGTLALIARMESSASVTPQVAQRAVRSLSEVEPNEEGEYAGALVKWFGGWIASVTSAASNDTALLQLLAGSPPRPPRYVDWEGIHYKVDIAAAEAARLSRLLGDDPRPSLSAALALISAADAIAATNLTKDALREGARQLDPFIDAMGWSGAEWHRAFAVAATRGDTRDAARLVSRLRAAADAEWARGARELAYAIALGQPEHAAVSVAEISQRHDFELHADNSHYGGPWALPSADVSPRGYHISGALLGVDAAFAEFWLTRVSTKAPPRKPTLSSEERAAFIATVPLIEPALLLDEDRDRIVSALQVARARVAALRTPGNAAALAASIPLGAIRQTLLPWTLAHDPDRVSSFLSPVELLWLGLGPTIPASMQAWGVLAQPRLGCLCVQVIGRRPLEILSGRVNAGILASGFPDLQLRLAELLAELHMPAPLLAGVLASATFDFVNGAAARDEDDRRALVEFVLALRGDRVEEYLAMLTTGGPLVPPGGASDRLEGVAPARRER